MNALVNLVSGENPLLTITSRGGTGKEALWGLFYKETNPIYPGSSLMT